jgi:hypothetical protein
MQATRTPIASSPGTMIHPLTGSDVSTLARLIRRHGLPTGRARSTLVGALGSAIARSPLSAAERGYVATATVSATAMPSPIFLLGHWRSGTTHLFNLLSGAPELTYAHPIPTGLPWDFLVLGRLLRPLLERAIPSERGIDPMTVTSDAPQEDEIALAGMGAPSYYHGVYFPKMFRREMARGLFFDGCDSGERDRWRCALRQFTRKVAAAGGGRRVLVKNPAHTAKIREIRAIWPGAKFVHIVRNPYHVYQSTTRMFDDLLGMLALQPMDRDQVTAAIHESYPRMIERVTTDAAELPVNAFVQVRFEDLESTPLDVVDHIAAQLDLPDRNGLRAAAEAHLARVAGYASRTRTVDAATARAVNTYWGRERDMLGYARAEPTAG